eukprot:CAMPEP_0170547888 /NCGR_PEP_ID=MMETSP0211-20121228/6201_1 /TAXON_ID=311385 /ORGANISM="Pseudokeronopsis sp., Strain OXSARD2" /LENGTH=69 /DNA_ID=CAMNT_0010853103 /DNA_START=816 /DNA_END=1025 /DNA_ORIENTATION=-
MITTRLCLFGPEAKTFIACPHVWNLPWEKNNEPFKAGDLFAVDDYVCISASSPGIGVNVEEFGLRFYDV